MRDGLAPLHRCRPHEADIPMHFVERNIVGEILRTVRNAIKYQLAERLYQHQLMIRNIAQKVIDTPEAHILKLVCYNLTVLVINTPPL